MIKIATGKVQFKILGFYLENQLGVNYDLDWYFGSDLVLNFSNPTFNFDFRFLNVLVHIQIPKTTIDRDHKVERETF